MFGSTTHDADVAQLVAHNLAKVRVAGSSPVIRSTGIIFQFRSVYYSTLSFVEIHVDFTEYARLAQRESASLTRKRSLVRSQYRAQPIATEVYIFHGCCVVGFADVAQLVAHNLAKVRVAGSSPVIRSMHEILKGQLTALLCYCAS